MMNLAPLRRNRQTAPAIDVPTVTSRNSAEADQRRPSPACPLSCFVAASRLRELTPSFGASSPCPLLRPSARRQSTCQLPPAAEPPVR